MFFINAYITIPSIASQKGNTALFITAAINMQLLNLIF